VVLYPEGYLQRTRCVHEALQNAFAPLVVDPRQDLSGDQEGLAQAKGEVWTLGVERSDAEPPREWPRDIHQDVSNTVVSASTVYSGSISESMVISPPRKKEAHAKKSPHKTPMLTKNTTSMAAASVIVTSTPLSLPAEEDTPKSPVPSMGTNLAISDRGILHRTAEGIVGYVCYN